MTNQEEGKGERAAPCKHCTGRGWYSDHATDCLEEKCSHHCPTQYECLTCGGTGNVKL